ARLLHWLTGLDSRHASRAARAAQPLEPARRTAVAASARGDEPALGALPVADLEPGDELLCRSPASGRAQPRSSFGRRCWHCARDREGLRRVREWWPRTRTSSRDDRGARGPAGSGATRLL